jgi:hypothetical protein
MATKKKKVVKKKAAPRKSTGGIASYTRKIQNTPAVKSAAAKIKKLETALKAVKKAKAAAVKKARAAAKK